MDPFEQLLKSQLLRDVPPEWRAEILASASVAAAAGSKKSAVIGSRWSVWLWPSPYAWGGLAAVWLVILGLNSASQGEAGRQIARGPVQTEREVLVAMAERQREWEAFFPKVKARSAPPPAMHLDSSGAMLDRREGDGAEIV